MGSSRNRFRYGSAEEDKCEPEPMHMQIDKNCAQPENGIDLKMEWAGVDLLCVLSGFPIIRVLLISDTTHTLT
jgi:hypothetical protein